jgi:hypothetical protein
MKAAKILFYLLLCLIPITSCNKTPHEVENILRKAGNNRKELQKVIDHYKKTGERKKLKAAFFLIANMENKCTVTGENVRPYFNILKEVTRLKPLEIKRDSLDKLMKFKIDSLEKNKGRPVFSQLTVLPDINTITADFLIKNIDQAFMVWEKPWAKHLNFAEFCEFILPYRIHNEPLSNWREYFYNHLISFQDSVKDKSDPKQLIEKISNYLYRHWTHLDNFNSYDIYPNLIEMAECNGGLCDHRYFLITAMFRSIGLPVSIEFTPQWTNYTGGHSWNVFIDTDGRIRPFNGGEDNFRYYEKNLIPMGDGGSICTKVYRQTFARQKESLPVISDYTQGNNSLNKINMVDVTENYDFPKMHFILKLDDDKLNDKIVYLCTFNYGYNINYVAFAKVKKNKADFKFIGLPAFYTPSIFYNNQALIVHAPLVFYKEKEKRHEYKPDYTKIGTIRLYRKFGFSGEFLSFAKGMIGAKFQGSNNSDFSDAVNLTTIKSQAKAYEELVINVPQKFRYVRYLATDSADARVAEIEFWSGDNKNTEKLLEGEAIGYSKKTDYENDAIFKNAFDKNIKTNFNAKAGSWVGLDLGEKHPSQITKIWYIPRNNQNEITKNHLYELFYLSDRWISLGKQIADKHYLLYNNVPTEALLLLKDLTEGKQERIFMYDTEKNEQIWW